MINALIGCQDVQYAGENTYGRDEWRKRGAEEEITRDGWVIVTPVPMVSVVAKGQVCIKAVSTVGSTSRTWWKTI